MPSPSEVLFIDNISSSVLISFKIYPSAPLLMASVTSDLSLDAVKTNTLTDGSSAFISFVASVHYI